MTEERDSGDDNMPGARAASGGDTHDAVPSSEDDALHNEGDALRPDDSPARAQRLAALIPAFAERRIVVLGDLVADQFLYGEIGRVSREAPVLILRHERTETVPGGAANCALNLAVLGARAAIVGVVGEDETGRALVRRLEIAGVDCRGVVRVPYLRTTTKVRVLAGHAHSMRQQVIRIDYENPLPRHPFGSLVPHLAEMSEESDAVIVSDYNYGAASREETYFLQRLARERNKLVFVDSRFSLNNFSGFTSATPNEDEVEKLVGRRLTDAESLAEAGRELRARLRYRALLITRGSNGMLLLEEGAEARHIEAVSALEAVDVTGAGDTVIATYALALASGASFEDAAHLANHAGGLVVMKRGTASVNPEELLSSVLQGGHT